MQTISIHEKLKHDTAQAVIFDLDGVLMDSEWLTFKVWRELAAEHGGYLEDSMYSEITGTTAEETARIIMRRTGVQFGVAESVQWAWNQVSERLKTEIEPLPGCHDLVEAINSRNIPLAIASNSSSSYIVNALSGLNLRDYFQVTVGIDQVSQGKPAPDVYLRAAELLNVLPERCLVIEDSRVGVQAAAAAGMRPLAVPNPRDHKNGFDGAWRVFGGLPDIHHEIDKLLDWRA